MDAIIRNWLEIDIFLIKFTFFRFLDTNAETMYSHKTKEVDRLTVSTKKIGSTGSGTTSLKIPN